MFEPLPIAYNIQDDNMVTILIVICFILCAVSLAEIWRYLLREFSCMFIRRDYSSFFESPYIIRYQILMNVQTVIIYPLLTYLLCNNFSFLFCLCLFAIYFLLKRFLYLLTNKLFFNKKQHYNWNHVILFNVSIQGVFIFFLTLLKVYVDMPDKVVLILIAVVLIWTKFSLFYKSYDIFFRNIGGFFQNILYLCALEIAPLLTLLGILLGFIDMRGVIDIIGLQ